MEILAGIVQYIHDDGRNWFFLNIKKRIRISMTSRTPCCERCCEYDFDGTGKCFNPSCPDCHAAPVEEWATEFHRKYCTYISGAPGRWKLREDADVVSMEIFIGLLLSSHGKREYRKGYERGTIENIPNFSVSVWEQSGQKLGYWKYFEKLARHAVLEEVENWIRDNNYSLDETEQYKPMEVVYLEAILKYIDSLRTETKDV